MVSEYFIFDTHCHLADDNYKDEDIVEIIAKAKKTGVEYILNVGYSGPTNKKVLDSLKFFSNLFAALGLHPCENEDLNDVNFHFIEDSLSQPKVIAIGEIGLDYYHNYTEIDKQKYWFKKQLILAKKHNLPVLLHIRSKPENFQAFDDAYEIIKEIGSHSGVLHCFSAGEEIAKKFIELGFYISLSGNITYKNKTNSVEDKRLERMIKIIPMDRIVVETDSPYLSPEPLRGQKNYPHNIIHTIFRISEIKKIDLNEVKKKIYKNSLSLLRLEGKKFLKNSEISTPRR